MKTDAENNAGPQPEFIKGLFNSISETYDTANDVITFGMARSWRKQLVRWSGARPGQSVLDCATGTGDLAIEFKKAVGNKGTVIGSDFSEGMLLKAPAKAEKAGAEVCFELGDATQLPYADASFDVTSIAYGIRNVSNPILALTEMARVTKSGGCVMILETGEIETPVLKECIGVYFRHVVPRLGGWVSGNRGAYEYLQGSSQKFPSGPEFIALMEKTGRFSSIKCRKIMGGASYLYKGTV